MIRPVVAGRGPQAFASSLRAARELSEDRPVILFDPSIIKPVDVIDEVFGVVGHSDQGFFDGTALVMRTSGSTSGTGSLVAISREAIVASARATEESLGGPGRWVTCLPTDHIAGFQTVFRSALAGFDPVDAGAGHPEDLAKAVQALGSERAYLSLVPTQLHRLLASDLWKEALRFDCILVGGAATAPSLLDEARNRGLAVRTTYGMTETCGGCVYDGAPIGSARATLDDSGRITLSGECVALGYLGSGTFDGVFRTSDIGRRERDGTLRILGRADDAILSGGATIMPAAIEDELARLGSGECLVVGIPDDEWGEIAVALTENAMDEEDTREALARRMGREWTPQRILSVAQVGVEAIPTAASGKPSRRGARDAVLTYLKPQGD